MPDEVFTLEDLAREKARQERERSRLPYSGYLENLQTLLSEGSRKVVGSSERPAVRPPRANESGEFVCIREPLEFMGLFKECNGKDECVELFQRLLSSYDPRVVEQVVAPCQPEGFWFNTTEDGINLRPGLENEEWASPTAIRLGDDAVHALVAGRTGSGKSVFLNSLVFSLLAEYSLWELNLFLVDFKKVEFSRYLTKYEVPHIKAVAATSEIRYVLSLLSYLSRCMNARQNFLMLVGRQKISELREDFGIVLPRVLVVVDEFQQLFLEATGKEQAQINDLLTSITKLGRATGFHLMFASQEMSGTLSSNVFANFKARFALACDAEVSSRVLGNSAASRLDKMGLVLANASNGKEETNQIYKVPFVSPEYFDDYLESITTMAEGTRFQSVHKFYDEDRIKPFDKLSEVLSMVAPTRRQYLDASSGLFDILTLGEAVVFNYKKHDLETAFVERGVRKNIGVFSPSIDDTAYVCKLLAANFTASPKAGEYRHLLLVRNDLFMKKVDLVEELDVPESQVFTSSDFMAQVVALYSRRRQESNLVMRYPEYSDLSDFAYDSFVLRANQISDGLSKEEEEAFRAIGDYFVGRSPQDIPAVEKRILEDFELNESFFHVLRLLHERVAHGKSISELFVPTVVWIIGAEMMDKLPRETESMLADGMNYNILVIAVGSDVQFDDFYTLNRNCDYLFTSGNNEAFYDKLRMTFTKKPENAIVIDFAIRSTGAERSFKKFKYELNEVVVPSIDFDSILE